MLRRLWPIALALLGYVVLCAILYGRVAHVTDGRDIYPLDDTYIQAAIGRNLAFYHSYGISPHVFAAASSSILWPFLLAIADYIFGLHIWIPLAWNMVFAVLLVVSADRIFRKLAPCAPTVARLLLLLSVVLFTSLATITFVAMEHVLQALTFVLFVYFAAIALERTHEIEPPDSLRGLHTNLWLILTATLTTLSRFEGVFVVAVVCLQLTIRGRRVTAAAVALSGAIPLAVFASFSILHGGYALPNSLLMKAPPDRINLISPNGLIGPYSLQQGLAVLVFAALALLALARFRNLTVPRPVRYCLTTYVAVALMHCQLARLGWLGRYEFYLIVAGIVFCGSALASLACDPEPHRRDLRRWLSGASAILLAACLVQRARDGWRDTVRFAEATYVTEVQFGRFLSAYYDTASIVANDVGAISYLSHIQCLDLAALGSNEVSHLVLQKKLNRATVDRIAHEHNARIALLFKNRFFADTSDPDLIPTDWIEVGHFDDPTFPEMQTVYFMAVDSQEVEPLRQHFLEFIQHLPPKSRAIANPASSAPFRINLVREPTLKTPSGHTR